MFPVDSKILIVDDSNFTRSVLKESLRHMKYWKILEAADARIAQQVLQEEEQVKDPVHLIISDVNMPHMTGLEFLRWLRAQEDFKSIPVIMLTTMQEKGSILEAARLGVSHYMIKPFDISTLRERMQTAWDKHGQTYVAEKKQPT